MKIWRFYLKPDKDIAGNNYELYAITNNKKIAKAFMESRNMDKFIVRKSDEESSTYVEMATQDRAKVLDVKSLRTKSISANGFETEDHVDVVCTDYEYQNCEEEYVESVLFMEDDLKYGLSNGIIPVDCFNSKLQDALRIFQYPLMCNLFNDLNESYDAPDFKIDELAVLISEFRNTF